MLSKTLLCLIVLRYYSYLFVLCYRSQVRVKTMAEIMAARTSTVIIKGDTYVVVGCTSWGYCMKLGGFMCITHVYNRSLHIIDSGLASCTNCYNIVYLDISGANEESP